MTLAVPGVLAATGDAGGKIARHAVVKHPGVSASLRRSQQGTGKTCDLDPSALSPSGNRDSFPLTGMPESMIYWDKIQSNQLNAC
jgi:hypothetical protein